MTGSLGPDPWAAQVVVPAHDEAATIGQCVTSIQEAIANLHVHTGVRAGVTVVADDCSDDTARIAAALGAEVVEVGDRAVGPARNAGVRRALAAHRATDPSRLWIAMTDADSTVPPDWLVEQLAAAASGTELWVGRVVPDPASLPATVLRAWWASHGPHADDRRIQHVHGANLAFTAAVFLAVGGFEPVAEHEDVAFVRDALRAGATWTLGDAPVQTSGREHGRTPGGFAGYLRALAAQLGTT